MPKHRWTNPEIVARLRVRADRRALLLGMTKGHIMEHTFKTAEEVGFDVPLEYEGWLYAANFSCLLPDRLNVSILRVKAGQQFPDSMAVAFVSDHDDGDPNVVDRVHVLFYPLEEVSEWVADQLYIIERDGILDEELYWPLVDPVIQKLWEEATTPERMKLCAQGEVDPSHIFDEEVHVVVHALLYSQISE